MRRYAFLLCAAAGAAACSSEPKLGTMADTGLVLATSERAKDSLILLKDSLLADRQRQLSEQSQLIGDAATSARLISEINGSLSKVRGLKTLEDSAQTESALNTAAEELTVMHSKVNAVIARLNASESRVRRMRKDSTASASLDSTQVAQLRDYERSIDELRANVEQQRQEIGVLTQRVDSMMQVNVALTARHDSVVTVARAMQAHDDSVFVVIGTEKELTEKGVVRKEGGAKLLFGIGKTLVPSRNINPAAFTAISKVNDSSITLPQSDKAYQLVSRQNLAYTNVASLPNAQLRGSVQITDPERFWASSKYLILVQR